MPNISAAKHFCCLTYTLSETGCASPKVNMRVNVKSEYDDVEKDLEKKENKTIHE